MKYYIYLLSSALFHVRHNVDWRLTSYNVYFGSLIVSRHIIPLILHILYLQIIGQGWVPRYCIYFEIAFNQCLQNTLKLTMNNFLHIFIFLLNKISNKCVIDFKEIIMNKRKLKNTFQHLAFNFLFSTETKIATIEENSTCIQWLFFIDA